MFYFFSFLRILQSKMKNWNNFKAKNTAIDHRLRTMDENCLYLNDFIA